MLDKIHQIQEWFKKNVGIPAPNGSYVVPVNGQDWRVVISDDKITIKSKEMNLEEYREGSGWEAYGL